MPRVGADALCEGKRCIGRTVGPRHSSTFHCEGQLDSVSGLHVGCRAPAGPSKCTVGQTVIILAMLKSRDHGAAIGASGSLNAKHTSPASRHETKSLSRYLGGGRVAIFVRRSATEEPRTSRCARRATRPQRPDRAVGGSGGLLSCCSEKGLDMFLWGVLLSSYSFGLT